MHINILCRGKLIILPLEKFTKIFMDELFKELYSLFYKKSSFFVTFQ